MGLFNEFFNFEAVLSGRILRQYKISSLSTDFNNNGEPFTVFIKPKVVTNNQVITLDVALIKEYSSIFKECPFVLNQWSPCIILSIKANSSILADYDIYVGMGR